MNLHIQHKIIQSIVTLIQKINHKKYRLYGSHMDDEIFTEGRHALYTDTVLTRNIHYRLYCWSICLCGALYYSIVCISALIVIVPVLLFFTHEYHSILHTWSTMEYYKYEIPWSTSHMRYRAFFVHDVLWHSSYMKYTVAFFIHEVPWRSYYEVPCVLHT